MTNQVQFIQLSQEEYDNISSKNPGSLYFTTDTHRIYKGGDLYASTTFDSLEFEDLSATSIKVDGKDVSLEGHTHTKSEISDFPTNVSSFTNDAGYITQSDVDLTSITSKIPEQASPTNQLADKDFVNSSIMTNTAYFKGTFNSVDELPTDRVTPNDYAFVIGKDSAGNTTYNRYKFTADGQWLFEYTLNNSSFTAEQWATINSGITSASLDEYATIAYVDAKIQNQPTMTLSGEYEDGTQFSFDAVIHN